MSLQDDANQRFKSAAINHFKSKDPALTEAERVQLKGKAITEQVRKAIEPILKAGGGHDTNALGALISNLYMQSFDSFSKDELVQLCTVMHTCIAMENVAADPDASGTPDLLSGQ